MQASGKTGKVKAGSLKRILIRLFSAPQHYEGQVPDV